MLRIACVIMKFNSIQRLTEAILPRTLHRGRHKMTRISFFTSLISLVNILNGSKNFLSFPDFKLRNYAEKIVGGRLNGSTIKQLNVSSEMSCQIECVADNRCLSYNLIPITGMDVLICELSDSDRFVGYQNFTRQVGGIYRGLESICERESPCINDEVCIPDYEDDAKHSCKCIECPRHCQDLYLKGSTTDGVYLVYPDNGEAIQVLCDMTTEGGGWTVFQRRMDGSVDFYLGWEDYRVGFGNLNGEFWLGNNNLHRLTANVNMMLRVDLEDYDGVRKYAEYTTVSVADANDNYRLTIDGYQGTAGDSMVVCGRPAKNMMFTTQDRDNDVHGSNCAVKYTGAWWYNYCHCANLNGLYQGGGHAQGVVWSSWRGLDYSLKIAEMKVRPKTA
ncbi:unnamed protein product [Porites lobata]|uniref:Fibrinogen C-terminal domain-containing protein n=1 Tax=Porites lobata TaxID=104759 RepID=A0ABN8NPM8_9CNID|nr:unnamed protein product [Porites lobata]